MIDWTTPVTAPVIASLIAIILAYPIALINDAYWDKIGKIWHTVQFYSLLLFGGGLVYFTCNLFNVEHWYLILLIMMFTHWYWFERFLNDLRGLDAHYVGTTSKLDKLARKTLKNASEANLRDYFALFKWFSTFFLILLYGLLTK